MPGISAPRTGHRAGRPGSLRGPLLALVLVPSLGLAAVWGYAVHLLRGSGQRTALLTGSTVVTLVVLISLCLGLRVSRTLSARLTALRADTLALAQREIPDVVGRLRAGEQVPVPPAWAPTRRTGDVVQQTSDGLAAVRQAAVAAIVHQAQGREGTKKVFLNIARRTQILIHRQISMLDALEREHEDPELLRELFAVDHLATRMRRNAENLVILGGALPARRWRNAVPVVNVLRSAVSETESYARVVVQGVPRVSLTGQAVADVIHLVAELIENGTTFSPPYTQVQVSAQEVPRGLAVEVEDRGLGMTEEEYERLNEYLANPPELDVSALGDDLRLGLFVVARLAARHDVRVALRPSPYGGTRAVVLLPSVLLEQAGQPAAVPGLPSGARITRTPVAEAGSEDGSGAGSGTGGGAGVGSGSGNGIGSGSGSAFGSRLGADGLAQVGEERPEPSGATAGVFGGLLGGAQGVPGAAGPFGAPGAPAVPFGSAAPVGPGGPAAPPAPDGPVTARAVGGAGAGGAVAEGSGTEGSGADGAIARADRPDTEAAGEAWAEGTGTGGAGTAPVNGGLPVGARIPGLPGAVVVPRPVPPRMYDLSAGPGGGVGGSGHGGGVGAAPAGPPTGPAAGIGGGPDGHSPPAREHPRESPPERGPDGELRTPPVLPQRVRNASLAEQLREAHPFGAPAPTPAYGAHPAPTVHRHDTAEADDPSPARSRATMAAIQRGTRSARAAVTGPDTPTPPTDRAATDAPATPATPQQAPMASPATHEAEEQQP
ncbi:sensor histidine kinase [Kitasatospora sp. NPDC056783]|uniref:sensor histidine kinase n=1 Tax=Kitasatospora sp. NPDC056783 TaxID=3345943 RepID=UPI00369874D5